jgi:hypothetical protein
MALLDNNKKSLKTTRMWALVPVGIQEVENEEKIHVDDQALLMIR